MANEEHLALLKQGVAVWNQWRQEHRKIRPDLSEAYLSEADLSEADLSRANLYQAYLSGAILRRAELSGAILRGTNLESAYLSQSSLRGAILERAFLEGANMREADLNRANLSGTDLNMADLTHVRMNRTILIGLDFRQVKGLKTVQHEGPSYIDIQTVYMSHGDIPESFLRGAGMPENFIEYMRSLVGKPIDYYSAFISYSSKDDQFARRLYNDLQGAGVRCWFAPEDLKTGDKFWERIDESIRIYDRLLVLLSEHSINSPWVEEEVTTAIEKEHQHPGKTVLFPIRLDDTIMTTARPWAASLRRNRHITDFTGWKQHDAYQKAFDRLLRDLKAASTAT